MKKPLIIIVGPTAVGKTEISIEIAKRLDGEIISADSMQIYKYMNIGTAKPTKEEIQDIPHYLIDEVEPDQEFNVALFQKKAFEYIDIILSKKKLPIIVGGTGLYINSLIYPLNFTESVSDWEYRNKLNKVADEKGNIYLYNLLEKIDPESAKKIHPNNRKRVIRALEVYKKTGKKMSHYKKEMIKKDSPFSFIMIGLNMDRQLLYEKINQRVDIMIEKGLIKEVRDLLNKGYDKNLISMQGLGYKEIIQYLEGRCTLEEAVYIIKRDTRRFAKRQLTWFRRDKRIYWFQVDKYSSKNLLIDKILQKIHSNLLDCKYNE
ncbi:tRNA (adenosine(37)-N6)-dimethylallyltransferase MiaA [Garciella nitratireducens]|uniref:tRNA (adenosine(37)-N6)-dimethylallyltransferase MiaA n=1 Tax=Garciella nitratireducens TaxID=218205 RepID=UPI000DE9638D|nr:tRNA (adenosine(37)-N6)-dimethylallyltransferase MiaA [Garciella nitratireducens]RBP45604.1 tRNA dimethylallyltransferase [Garciella nitratireducens]